jgi:integrase
VTVHYQIFPTLLYKRNDIAGTARQQRAGHKNISNTMIYTHVSDEQASESCEEALMTAFA